MKIENIVRALVAYKAGASLHDRSNWAGSVGVLTDSGIIWLSGDTDWSGELQSAVLAALGVDGIASERQARNLVYKMSQARKSPEQLRAQEEEAARFAARERERNSRRGGVHFVVDFSPRSEGMFEAPAATVAAAPRKTVAAPILDACGNDLSQDETAPAKIAAAPAVVNLTPHAISVGDGDARVTFPPSGAIARVTTHSKKVGELLGFPVSETVLSAVEGLPAPALNTVYLVSGLVLARVSGRKDVLAPDTGNTAIRENGQIIAVRGFVQKNEKENRN